MRKGLSLLTLLISLIPLQLFAGDRTEEEMRNAATSVLNSNNRRAAGTEVLKEFLSMSKLKIYGYDNGGFAVITTDDRFESVIGVSKTKYKENIPCGFQWWLETVNDNMQNVKDVVKTNRSQRASNNNVAPLISTTWGQDHPYNDSCYYEYNGNKYQFVTGCVATVMAQIMNYYQYPKSGTGSNSYNVNYGDFKATFSQDFSKSVYDWDNMLNNYDAYLNSNERDVHTKAVAKLMKDCGISVNMVYGNKESSSSVTKAGEALKKYFFYDSNQTKLYNRSEYNKDAWLNMLYKEIDNGRPLIYAGNKEAKTSSAGHAFILNGYDATGKFYVNWGWEGYMDGLYDIDLLNTLDGQSYNYNHQLLVAVPDKNAGEIVYNTLTLTASGNGYVSKDNAYAYGVNNTTANYKIKDKASVMLFFTPDLGYQVKSLKVNGTDVTSDIKDNQYTISSITKATTVTVEFSEKQGYLDCEYNMFLYSLATSEYDEASAKTVIKFQIVNAGSESINLKKVIVRDPETDETLYSFDISEAIYGGGTIGGDVTTTAKWKTTPEFDFIYTYKSEEHAYIASKYRILTLTTNPYGAIKFSDLYINDQNRMYSVPIGTDVQLTFSPYEDCKVTNAKVNDENITAQISDNIYTITAMKSHTSVNVVFDRYYNLYGHAYVDLGLPSGKCWSKANYGAYEIYAAGEYLAEDAANTVKKGWGEDWLVPSKDDVQELIDNCQWTWDTQNDVHGYTVKGPNGNTIFLPAVGVKSEIGYSFNDSLACYQTSTSEGREYIWMLIASSQEIKFSAESTTTYSYPVRPVCSAKPSVYTGKDMTYGLTDGKASILSGKNTTGVVEIATTVEIDGKAYDVTSIAEDAFKGNTKVTGVTIPTSVTAIGKSAFDGCTGLTVINIGQSVVSIGSKAFANIKTAGNANRRADATLTVKCNTKAVPSTSADAFENTPINTAKLLVNDEIVASYKATVPWSLFGSIMGFKEAAGIETFYQGKKGITKIFTLEGKQIKSPQKGINIIRMSNGQTRKIVVK